MPIVPHYDINAHLRRMEPLPTGMAPGGKTRGVLRAVLFDIYGTLFISGSGDIGVTEENFRRSNAMDALRRHYQIPWSAEQMAHKLFAAIRQYHASQKSDGVDYPEVQIDQIWQGILEWEDMTRARGLAEAYEAIVNPTYPMPGLDQVLRTLRRRGMTMGIISNAQFFTPRLFKKFLGAPPEALGFSKTFTLYSFQFGRAKPSVALFETLAERLQNQGIHPESALYVGNDMRNDILPAQAVGFQTALFAGDQRSLRRRADDPALQGITPSVVITDLCQILEFDMYKNHPG
jgi:putative hydrolase of the HAD superfamily